jgi:hypothetical protein
VTDRQLSHRRSEDHGCRQRRRPQQAHHAAEALRSASTGVSRITRAAVPAPNANPARAIPLVAAFPRREQRPRLQTSASSQSGAPKHTHAHKEASSTEQSPRRKQGRLGNTRLARAEPPKSRRSLLVWRNAFASEPGRTPAEMHSPSATGRPARHERCEGTRAAPVRPDLHRDACGGGNGEYGTGTGAPGSRKAEPWAALRDIRVSRSPRKGSRTRSG